MSGEFQFITKVLAAADRAGSARLGAGDDAAWLAPAPSALVGTDTLVEGVHFRLDWSSPRDVGFKALSTNLSDLAAMGGRPRDWLLNLTLPPERRDTCLEIVAGMAEAAAALVPEAWPLGLIGGDVTSTSGPIVITITALGDAPKDGPIRRTGARPGDAVVLFGRVGLAACGLDALACLAEKQGADEVAEWFPESVFTHRRPQALVRLGAALGEAALPSAMIDVSDGLVQDAGHLARGSGARVRLDPEQWHPHPELNRLTWHMDAPHDVLARAWTGGDDYALLATIPPARLDRALALASRHGAEARLIGQVEAGAPEVVVSGLTDRPGRFKRAGFDHFL